MIGKLMDAGVNIFRLNMSHAPHDWVRRVVKDIRAESAARAQFIGIMMDTQGPAIRTGDLGVPLDLQPGQKFTLTVRGERDLEEHSVDVNYENFINDISVGDVVLIDNGAIEMKVLAKAGNKVECEVLTEGHARQPPPHQPARRQGQPARAHGQGHQGREARPRTRGGFHRAVVRARSPRFAAARELFEEGKPPPLVIAKIEDQQAIKSGIHRPRSRRHHGGARRSGH
jgi:pyruvate kinase